MTAFYRLLAATLLAVTANNFVWFALTYWAYLSTRSVVTTSVMAGIYLVMMAVSGIWLGSIVDHNKKRSVLMGSSATTLTLFLAAAAYLHANPASAFSHVGSVPLWIFIALLLFGTIAGSLYNIAIPTLVGILVPEDRRDRANGLYGTVSGVSFGVTSVASGFALAFGGMEFVLAVAVACIALALVALAVIDVPEGKIVPPADEAEKGKVDLRGTIAAVRSVPGLFALIFFTTFNNFLGGVFFSLLDAYGLSLVSVEVWGTVWGMLSFGIILGGLYVAKKGLGSRPLRLLFQINLITWGSCVFFAIQPSIALLVAGAFTWMFFFPFIEATEQTIFQKVVPPERLGRVFGFAHSVEQSAAPLTAFFIGPIAQYVFIPYMTTGAGVRHIGGWFGVGEGRGIALVFIISGIIGFIVTLMAMHSRSHARLAEALERKPDVVVQV